MSDLELVLLTIIAIAPSINSITETLCTILRALIFTRIRNSFLRG